LPECDARQIVTWILSLKDDRVKQKSLPVAGTLKPTLDKAPTENGVLVLSASYTDKGGNGLKPLTGTTTVSLRNNKSGVAAARNLKGFALRSFNGMQFLSVPKERASFSIDSIDLTGITSVELAAGGNQMPRYGYLFELRLDGPDGQKIGEGTLSPNKQMTKTAFGFGTLIKLNMQPVNDGRLHNLYIVSKPLNPQEEGTLVISAVEFKADGNPAVASNSSMKKTSSDF
jgi:cytochrome c